MDGRHRVSLDSGVIQSVNETFLESAFGDDGNEFLGYEVHDNTPSRALESQM